MVDHGRQAQPLVPLDIGVLPMLDLAPDLRQSNGLRSVEDTVGSREHLCRLDNHLDHMLVAHILSRKKRIAVEYENVHA